MVVIGFLVVDEVLGAIWNLHGLRHFLLLLVARGCHGSARVHAAICILLLLLCRF